MNKVALLFLGTFAPLVFDQVLNLFDSERFRIFLHIDSKRNLSEYLSKLKNLEKVTLIQNRVQVYWGGFSMVEAEIALIEAALQYPDVANLVLLSDDSAPLKSPTLIYEALAAVPDRITCEPNGRPRQWYDRFYYTDSTFSSLRMEPMQERYFTDRDAKNIERMEALRKRGKKPIPAMFFGRQWWALGRSSAEKVLDYIKNDDHFVESFRFSLFPDEIFFPTAYRMCFPDQKTANIPTYADYGRPVHPWVFTSAEEILATKFSIEHLFIRKIRPNMPEIIPQLAATWS